MLEHKFSKSKQNNLQFYSNYTQWSQTEQPFRACSFERLQSAVSSCKQLWAIVSGCEQLCTICTICTIIHVFNFFSYSTNFARLCIRAWSPVYLLATLFLGFWAPLPTLQGFSLAKALHLILPLAIDWFHQTGSKYLQKEKLIWIRWSLAKRGKHDQIPHWIEKICQESGKIEGLK